MILEEWLLANGLDHCLEPFRENQVDLDIIALLTEEDLREMGIPIGLRRRFFLAVRNTDAAESIEAAHEAPSVAEETYEDPSAELGPLPQSEIDYSPESSPPTEAVALSIPEPPPEALPLSVPDPLPEAIPLSITDSPPKTGNPKPRDPALRTAQIPADSPPSRQSRVGGKAVAVGGAVIVHLIILLIAALLVLFPKQKEAPEIVAQIAPRTPPSQKMQKKAVQKQLKKAPSAAAAAAAPMAQLMRANAVARITLPQVTRISTGPLGIGESNLGNGAFGSGISGSAADGMTMFGGAAGSGLPGTFYDMKQNQARKPNGQFEENSYRSELRAFAASRFNRLSVSKFYRAPRKLSLESLLVNEVSADEGPKAFQVQDEVNPMYWFVHYSGRLSPPQSGKWRFAGGFDNVLYIYVNNELVFDGGYRHPESEVGRYFPQPGFCIGTPVRHGKWVNLNGPFQLDILLGESGGSLMGGAILIEREGESYKKLANGTPILPLFAIDRKPRGDILKRMKIYPKAGANPYPFADANSSPVFHSL